MFWNQKVWCLNFLKPYRLSSDDILIRFYKLLNFVDFPFLKMRFYDYIVKIWVRGKTPPLSRNIYFSALDFVYFPNFGNIDVCNIFICRSIREYSVTSKMILSKSMEPGLSNAHSDALIAFLVPEKLTFELVKLTQ